MNVMKPKRKKINKATFVGFWLMFAASSVMAQTHRAVLPPVDADGFYAIICRFR